MSCFWCGLNSWVFLHPIFSIILSCFKVDSLCWPPLELNWQDWEGLQLQLLVLLLRYTSQDLLLDLCRLLERQDWDSLVGHYLISKMILCDVCCY